MVLSGTSTFHALARDRPHYDRWSGCRISIAFCRLLDDEKIRLRITPQNTFAEVLRLKEKIGRRTVRELISDELARLIASGILQICDELPSERELAALHVGCGGDASCAEGMAADPNSRADIGSVGAGSCRAIAPGTFEPVRPSAI